MHTAHCTLHTLSPPQVCTLHSATDHCELSLSLQCPHSLICSHRSPRRTRLRNPRPASRVAPLPAPMEPSPAVAAELWCPPHLAAGGGRPVEATSAVTEKSSGGHGGGSAVRRRPRETPASEEDSSRIVSTSGGGGGGQDLVGPLTALTRDPCGIWRFGGNGASGVGIGRFPRQNGSIMV